MAKRDAASLTTIDTSDNRRALEVIAAGGWSARLRQDKIVALPLPVTEIGRINERLVTSGLAVYEVSTVRKSLEDVFLELIGD
jgi:hypothetical protein